MAVISVVIRSPQLNSGPLLPLDSLFLSLIGSAAASVAAALPTSLARAKLAICASVLGIFPKIPSDSSLGVEQTQPIRRTRPGGGYPRPNARSANIAIIRGSLPRGHERAVLRDMSLDFMLTRLAIAPDFSLKNRGK